VTHHNLSPREADTAREVGIYNILSKKSIALQVQPQILASLSLVTWGQVYYYGHSWSLSKTSIVVLCLAVLGAGLELLGTLPFLYLRGDGSAPHAYLQAMAILSAVGLALGVLRHYWDIYTHKSVRGISLLFVGLDAAGDLASILSVGEYLTKANRWSANASTTSVIVKPIDVEGTAIYAVELALWIGILSLAAIFRLRAWLKRKESDLPVESVEMQGGQQDAEVASISSGSNRSVFMTVGLRQKALQLLRNRKRNVVV
jgi:hypothetical protein